MYLPVRLYNAVARPGPSRAPGSCRKQEGKVIGDLLVKKVKHRIYAVYLGVPCIA